jgi:hypothetical protein
MKQTKGSPIRAPFFPDTKAGVDHFTKTLKEDRSTTPAKAKEIDKLGVMMKRSALDYHIKSVKKFDGHDASTYPSRPEVRGKLLEIEKLEKDLEPTKKQPSKWNVLYQSMTPIEKGQWNAEQRWKKQERLKEEQEDQGSDQDLTKTIPREVNQIMSKEIENIRQMRIDAERLRRIPEVKFKTRKPEPAGLHEAFTQDKLTEGSILKQIRKDNEKV